MDRYETTFARLDERKQAAFVPFVVLGDPNPDDSIRIIQCLIDAGADALELGFPFSDPLADGPTIQQAMDRALKAKITSEDCFSILKTIRNNNPTLPIGLLLYANLVYARGFESFYRECQQAGVDSALVADVPVGESSAYREAANKHGIHPVFLCPPNVSSKTLKDVAVHSGGYTYLLSRAGITGTDVAAGRPAAELLEQLNIHSAAPPLLGFGISSPRHVTDAIASGAQGVICGSAIIERITKNLPDIEKVMGELTKFVLEMKAATNKAN